MPEGFPCVVLVIQSGIRQIQILKAPMSVQLLQGGYLGQNQAPHRELVTELLRQGAQLAKLAYMAYALPAGLGIPDVFKVELPVPASPKGRNLLNLATSKIMR